MRYVRSTALVAVAASAAILGSCFSPVQRDEIAAQGDEVPGVPEGEFHRYGQNCQACHGGFGPGPEFLISGTVFATPDSNIPVNEAIVTVTDATGQTKQVKSNCAGNFFIRFEEFDASFPLRAEVECPLPPKGATTQRNVMGTRINRDGGCAFCHALGPASSDSPGQLFCEKVQPATPFVVPDCVGGPNPSGGGG